MQAVREVIEGAVAARVEILTLFAFSTENWHRPEEEILALMTLLQLYAHQEKEELRDRGVRVRVLGDLSPLGRPVLEAVNTIESATRDGDSLTLNLMISYSGRAELLRAARALARRARDGVLDPEAIDEATLEAELDTAGLPDPDLLVRTSGEFRISNFMLWQLAYTEVHISPVLWPDFTRAHFYEALRAFQHRDRRFGRVPSTAR